MIITTPALAVAFRLSTVLPVRTHERREPPPARIGGHPGVVAAQHRRAEVRRMLSEGVEPKDMARALQISDVAVYKHIKAIEAELNADSA
jgi:DNA-binding NarL/FixJ family response regulator